MDGLYLKDGYGYFSDDVTYSKEGVYRSEYDRDSKSEECVTCSWVL